jgi:enoyl-CoA hydratase/carnithine racemase
MTVVMPSRPGDGVNQPAYNTLLTDRPTRQVVVARLHRPERLNAITFEMFAEFSRLQAEVEADGEVRALVLTGSGRAFCAGLDLEEASTLPNMPAAEMLRGQESWADAVAGFSRLSKPVIAAVNGAAAGAGMGLALAADIRIASTKARFNAAFVRIGLSGGDVGTSYLLPRLIGLGRASELLLTGRFVAAEEAARIGLVTDVVEPEELLDRALETAAMICANSPVGMRLTKHVLRTNVDAPSLEAALALENSNQVLATRTDDMVEALDAFRTKRTPSFVGH